MSISRGSEASGLERLACSKYYDVGKWQITFNLGLNATKNTHYIKKSFKSFKPHSSTPMKDRHTYVHADFEVVALTYLFNSWSATARLVFLVIFLCAFHGTRPQRLTSTKYFWTFPKLENQTYHMKDSEVFCWGWVILGLQSWPEGTVFCLLIRELVGL